MYAVQNPFLYGMYELRREQMKMQQEKLGANLKTGLKVRILKLILGLINTAVFRKNRTVAIFQCKMDFFTRAWQKVKVPSRP